MNKWINQEELLMSSLKAYYRKPKAFIELPSQGLMYEQSEDGSMLGEIGVMPMTMMNHLTTNNPESLINGHVLEELIRDCTTITSIPPRNLFKCDVDAIVVGIRMVSVSDTLDVTIPCPKCDKETDYGIDLRAMLAETTTHSELPYDLEFGDLTLKIIPTTLDTSINTEQSFFQDAKSIDQISRAMDSLQKQDSEEVNDTIIEKVKEIYDIQRAMTETTVRLYANSIAYVKTPDSEVYDRDDIFEFVKGLSDEDHNRLKDKVREISEVGIPKTRKFTCSHCEHEFEAPVELNPTDFFGNGSQ